MANSTQLLSCPLQAPETQTGEPDDRRQAGHLTRTVFTGHPLGILHARQMHLHVPAPRKPGQEEDGFQAKLSSTWQTEDSLGYTTYSNGKVTRRCSGQWTQTWRLTHDCVFAWRGAQP